MFATTPAASRSAHNSPALLIGNVGKKLCKRTATHIELLIVA